MNTELVNRFLKYVSFDTQSSEENESLVNKQSDVKK